MSPECHDTFWLPRDISVRWLDTTIRDYWYLCQMLHHYSLYYYRARRCSEPDCFLPRGHDIMCMTCYLLLLVLTFMKLPRHILFSLPYHNVTVLTCMSLHMGSHYITYVDMMVRLPPCYHWSSAVRGITPRSRVHTLTSLSGCEVRLWWNEPWVPRHVLVTEGY